MYDLRSKLAIRLANKIVDNLKFTGATSNDNLAQHLFDRISDVLVHLTDDELLLFSDGIRDYKQVSCD